MNNDELNNDELNTETPTETAQRELTEAREKHALAFLSAQAAPGDPEEAALLREATKAGKSAFWGYVQAAMDPLAAQINGIVTDNGDAERV